MPFLKLPPLSPSLTFVLLRSFRRSSLELESALCEPSRCTSAICQRLSNLVSATVTKYKHWDPMGSLQGRFFASSRTQCMSGRLRRPNYLQAHTSITYRKATFFFLIKQPQRDGLPKMKILWSFTHPHVIPNIPKVWLSFFLRTQKKVFWKCLSAFFSLYVQWKSVGSIVV